MTPITIWLTYGVYERFVLGKQPNPEMYVREDGVEVPVLPLTRPFMPLLGSKASRSEERDEH